MTAYDCFNGDADGICALTQLRLHNPQEATLVTGVKRDINLLDSVNVQRGDQVTALDISLDKNRVALERLLSDGAEVFYCDHHYAGEIPDHPLLTTQINTSPDVCTSLLINQKLKGRYLDWAVAGTFGDNLKRAALSLAKSLSLSAAQLQQLEALGVYLNYNGYGAGIEDLYFHPADLFQKTVKHKSALDFISADAETFAVLENGYREDMANAAAATSINSNDKTAIYELPNQAWSRRVSGVYGNELANRFPQRAHAVLTEREQGGYVVSIRAPLSNKKGADLVCRQFETGGGRAAAAGINVLPVSELDRFIKVFTEHYS